jgi:thiamine-phosphate pyrophosphorylase
MTDEIRVPNPAAVIARLPRGAAAIFRNYGDAHRAETALRLRALCKERGILFLVAGDAKLAVRLRADGVHWPERALRPSHGPTLGKMLITAAVHNEVALHRAERAGVDAVLISPVLATASHPGKSPLGVLRFARLAARSRVCAYALGGLTGATAQRLVATKAIGIAAIGAVTQAKD